MLQELGIPSQLEGLACLQLFKASRGYVDPAFLDLPSGELDGAVLRLGQLPDAYLKLRANLSAQLEDILAGFSGFSGRLETATERERRESRFGNRPMAVLIGWREFAVSRRPPLGEWDWVDLVAEYRPADELRDAMEQSLGRLAASLAVGLGELIEDRVATHSFWIAPGLRPVVVIREQAGSLDAFQRSGDAFPRAQAQTWADLVLRLPRKVINALAEPLDLLAASRTIAPSWLRFTLGWAALERLATELGKKLDDVIVVEQRRCPSCNADLPGRKPGVRPRLQQVMDALEMPDRDDLAAELSRINNLRGRSHGGAIPDGADLLAPERLASEIIRAVIEHPERVQM